MKKPLWFFLSFGLLLAAGWLGYALAGGAIGNLIAEHVGNALLRLGQGKFTDPAWFVYNRLREVLWLATTAGLLAFGYWCFNMFVDRRFAGAVWQGVARGIVGFILLNLWVGAATRTALFWGLLGLDGGVQNQMQFEFKRILLEENRTPLRAVLMGNSQTRSEIKEELLNQAFGGRLWTTELHFPGSQGYDVLLLEDQINKANPQIVICYVTGGYFYSGTTGSTVATFLGWRDLPELWRLGGERYLPRSQIFSGLMGEVCPIFRCRDVFVQRLFGPATAQLKQTEYDQALEPDLKKRADEEKSGLRLNAASAFQKRAFEVFIARCQAAHRRVILLEGSFNPVLEQRIDPAIRADMLDFLKRLKDRYPNVTLIPASALPAQTPADFVDLNHVNEDMQRRVTLRLADLLRPLLVQTRIGTLSTENMTRHSDPASDRHSIR